MSLDPNYSHKYFHQKDYIDVSSKIQKGYQFTSYLDLDQSNMEDELASVGADIINSNDSQKKVLFDEMEFYINNKCSNILLYGFGSKSDLIQEFLEERLPDYPKVIADGFKPVTSTKLLLNKLTSLVKNCMKGKDMVEERKALRATQGLKGGSQQLDLLTLALREDGDFPYEMIILAVNNFEGVAFQDSASMEVLSNIAKIHKITLIATADHVKFPTLLTPRTKDNFNFKYFFINSSQPYTKEIQFLEGFEQLDSNKGAEALQFIFKSLTDSQKGIIESLATFYVENPLTGGLEFKALYKLCFDNAILSNETQLKDNLVELLDHRIFKESKSDRGKTVYQLDYPKQILDRIVRKEFS